MFISLEHKVIVLLLKTYFGLIQHPLSCLTIFQRFWLWTPHIKPTYKMRMFEIAGVTSTGMTHFVGFGF